MDQVHASTVLAERFIDPFEKAAIIAPTPISDRDKVLQMEALMRESPEQIVIEPVHYFARGLYAREITIPKGTLLTGKIHLFEHINIISKGEISVLTEHGVKRIVAPATLISKPGIKRIGYAHEETVWTTIHACNAIDAAKAEKLLVVDTFEEFEKAIKDAAKEAECPLLP